MYNFILEYGVIKMTIRGIFAASMSVFNKNLTLDIDSTIRHSENLIENGCHGVAILGSTGQSQLISTSEKKKINRKIKC